QRHNSERKPQRGMHDQAEKLRVEEVWVCRTSLRSRPRREKQSPDKKEYKAWFERTGLLF
ncbi:MAG TPA: hypothetical protein PKA94_11230, partial [Ferruginibacter sp.]|nr:hypothetical protein [Ferruginibacter sp.]